MKNTSINFQWTEGEQEYKKTIDRQKMYSIFKGLAVGYSGDDNEISVKMVKDIIPCVDKISISKDYNLTQDIPMIFYQIGKETKVLKIKRRHKIVWSILDRYCTLK